MKSVIFLNHCNFIDGFPCIWTPRYTERIESVPLLYRLDRFHCISCSIVLLFISAGCTYSMIRFRCPANRTIRKENVDWQYHSSWFLIRNSIYLSIDNYQTSFVNDRLTDKSFFCIDEFSFEKALISTGWHYRLFSISSNLIIAQIWHTILGKRTRSDWRFRHRH